MQLEDKIRDYLVEQLRHHNITAYSRQYGLSRNALTAFATGQNQTIYLSAAIPIMRDMVREGVDLNELVMAED